MGRRNPQLDGHARSIPTNGRSWRAARVFASTTPPSSRPAAGAILIQGTDEAEIAIGIQRVLRTRALTVCFLEGHGELADGQL